MPDIAMALMSPALSVQFHELMHETLGCRLYLSLLVMCTLLNMMSPQRLHLFLVQEYKAYDMVSTIPSCLARKHQRLVCSFPVLRKVQYVLRCKVCAMQTLVWPM